MTSFAWAISGQLSAPRATAAGARTVNELAGVVIGRPTLPTRKMEGS